MQKTQYICIQFLRTCLYFRRADIWFSTVGSWRRILLTRRSIDSWGGKVPESVVILNTGIKPWFSARAACQCQPAKPGCCGCWHTRAQHTPAEFAVTWGCSKFCNSSSDAQLSILQAAFSNSTFPVCFGWGVRQWAAPQGWVHTPVYFLFGLWGHLLRPPVQHSLP